MTNFLPDSYKIPDTSNYMKFKEGENTFRVLSPAITGFEYWNNQNKPVRSQTPWHTLPADIRYKDDGTPEPVKHFWAFVVWNYDSNIVQILEIVQKSVQSQLKALVENKKWGDPTQYDITVTRTGSGFDTEYMVTPNPKTEMPKEALGIYTAKKIALEALYTGGDPFGTKTTQDIRENASKDAPDPVDIPFN